MKTIFATVVAITMVLFVMPVNAGLVVAGAEPITLCLEDGSCSEYIHVTDCVEDRFRPANCVTMAIYPPGSPVIVVDGCDIEPGVNCYRWHAVDE